MQHAAEDLASQAHLRHVEAHHSMRDERALRWADVLRMKPGRAPPHVHNAAVFARGVRLFSRVIPPPRISGCETPSEGIHSRSTRSFFGDVTHHLLSGFFPVHSNSGVVCLHPSQNQSRQHATVRRHDFSTLQSSPSPRGVPLNSVSAPLVGPSVFMYPRACFFDRPALCLLAEPTDETACLTSSSMLSAGLCSIIATPRSPPPGSVLCCTARRQQ